MTEPAGVDSGVSPPRFRERLRRLIVIDLLPAVWISLVIANSTFSTTRGLSSGTVFMVWLVALGVSVPLVVRRRRPIPVFYFVLISAIVAVLLGMSVAATALAVSVALYQVALSARWWRSAVALNAALVGVTLVTVFTATVLNPGFLLMVPDTKSFSTDLLSLSFSWFSIGAGWALGRSVRGRRESARQIVKHRAEKAISEERLRISREMHDVVAHSMSVIVMKAAVANHVYGTRPEESREALGVIESVGRAALADIHRVLGSLRSEEDTDLAPSPGLDEVPTLVENARLADVQVEFDRGTIPVLPTAVQLSAYRIVQEALTNVIKHAAAPVRCTVRITAESGELKLAVIDDGRSNGPIGKSGHGLIGMRKRAALHHGTLVAGRQPNGGFAVHARLPFDSRSA